MKITKAKALAIFFLGAAVGIGGITFADSDLEKMSELYYDGKKLYYQSDFYGAIQKLEEALALAKQLNDEKIIRSCLFDIGAVYFELHEYNKAAEYLEKSLAMHEKAEEKVWIWKSFFMLGRVYYTIGNNQKALSFVERAIKMDVEQEIKESFEGVFKLLIMNCLAGNVYSSLGRYQEALRYFEKSLNYMKSHYASLGLGLSHSGYESHAMIYARTYTGLADVYRHLGDYEKAVSYYEKGLEIAKVYMREDGIVSGLIGLGTIYDDLGDHYQATLLHEEAMVIARRRGKKKVIGDILGNLGAFSCYLGQYEKALELYEESLKLKKEIGVSTSRITGNIADVYLEMGDFKKAEAGYRKIGDEEWRLGKFGRLGNLELRKESYGKAIKYFEKDVAQAVENRDVTSLLSGYTGLGHGYLGLGKLEEARGYFEKAITLTMEQREGLSEERKSRFFMGTFGGFPRTESYEGMVLTLVEKGKHGEAFYFSESLKARVLSEAISGEYAGRSEAVPLEIRIKEEAHLTNIRELRERMNSLYRENKMDEFYRLEGKMKSMKAGLDNFVRTLRKEYPSYASFRYPLPRHTGELLLRDGEALVEFEVTAKETVVFIVQKGKVRIRRVPITRNELKKKVLTYRKYFEGIQRHHDLLQFHPSEGQNLYHLLFGDDLKGLTGVTTIILVPDEFLNILPFEALVARLPRKEKHGEGKFGPYPLGVQYFADVHNTTYAQSGTSLTLLRTLLKGSYTGWKTLVVCDPIFSKSDSRYSAIPRYASVDGKRRSENDLIQAMGLIHQWKQMGVEEVRSRGEKRAEKTEQLFPRLPKTQEIGTEMRNIFGNDAKVFHGSLATELKIREQRLLDYRYILFATHGILDNTIPWIQEPALVLGLYGNTGKHDGFFSAGEVMGLRLNAEVVALVACSTGVGEMIGGEGVMGMGRAFQYAGARNVMMSLWSVAEDATVALSNEFFRELKAGRTPRQALWLARSKIRRAGYEHPFYWAAFILMTD